MLQATANENASGIRRICNFSLTWKTLISRAGWALPEKLDGGVRPLPKTLTLFKTKIRDFPYPIYDLTNINSLC